MSTTAMIVVLSVGNSESTYYYLGTGNELKSSLESAGFVENPIDSVWVKGECKVSLAFVKSHNDFICAIKNV